MRFALKIIAASIVVAILSIGLSFIGEINVVWILAIAMFAANMEGSALLVGIGGGVILDVMMHERLGLSSLILAVGLIAFVIVRSLQFGVRWWQVLIMTFVVMTVCYVLDCVFSGCDVVGGWEHILKSGLINTMISFVVYMFVSYFKERQQVKVSF